MNQKIEIRSEKIHTQIRAVDLRTVPEVVLVGRSLLTRP
jgi:hypothetical protein